MIEVRAIERAYRPGILTETDYGRDASEARMIVVYDWVKNRKMELLLMPKDWGISYGSAYYSIGQAIHRMRHNPRFRDAYARYLSEKAAIMIPGSIRRTEGVVA